MYERILKETFDTDQQWLGDTQGHTLATYLFIIALDYALRKATERMEDTLPSHQKDPDEYNQSP